MSASASPLSLYRFDGTRLGAVEVQGVDVKFPSPDVQWVWVLDARCEPYPELERAEVFARAQKVRKKYVLMADGESADA
jgi:hypothetical protein